MSSSEIDMSCKLFGLLLGFVALLMVLVGLPAFLVSMEASTTVCVCHDNTDFYSASTTSDTVVRAELLAAAPSSGKRADMRTFTGLVTDTFKGRVAENRTLIIALVDSTGGACPLGAEAEAGLTYVFAGSMMDDGVLEVDRCGNLTRWDRLDNATLRFVRGMFNWATGTCAGGAPVNTCREDPCKVAACNVTGFVCVPGPCLSCDPPSSQALFWVGKKRVCVEHSR